MKKDIHLSVLGIALGELMMFSGHVYAGLAVHVINLQVITLALIFGNRKGTENVLQSLILLLLLRIINLAMPQFFTANLLWYPLVYGVMFLPVYSIIRYQQIPSEELGINFSRMHIYLPAAILIGAVFALLEHGILHPKPLIDNLKLPNLILITMVMFVFVGVVEELIFRSILQTRLEKVLGLKHGLFLSGVIFGIMHSGYGVVNEILFAVFFGIMIGYIFQKTRSFPFILTIHGTANVLLFGILPMF